MNRVGQIERCPLLQAPISTRQFPNERNIELKLLECYYKFAKKNIVHNTEIRFFP